MTRFVTSAVAAVLVCAGLSSAHAQEQLTVTVPFSFVVNSRTLPAGTYMIRPTFFHQQKSLFLTSENGRASVLATTFDDGIRGDKLVFRRYGSRYFLTDVATQTGNLHFTPEKSAIRKQLAEEEVIGASGK
jgi:hypothetical protein